jgi:uncharacterized protein (DUF1015 family)
LRYNPAAVDLDTVLAPPYDVIDAGLRRELYARGEHNVVRVDAGEELAGDRAGTEDRYTRARALLGEWVAAGILVRDGEPSYYVADHWFPLPDGATGHRRGLFATIAATAWEQAPIRPHERTLRGPKADRLALMSATGMNTSAVFGVWTGADQLAAALDDGASGTPAIEAGFPGEQGPERVRLWVVAEPVRVHAIAAAAADATLYIADGHHRYETAAAHAQAAGRGCGLTLVYLSAAADPNLQLLPTHRMIRPRTGVPGSAAEVTATLPGGFAAVAAASLEEAMTIAAGQRDSHHAFALVAGDGFRVIARPRSAGGSGRVRDHLDVSVLERELLSGWGIGAEELAGGALGYDHSAAAVEAAVRDGTATLGVLLNRPRVEEMLAIADAGDTMPQKSTYFYPKVPTGLVISPLGGS